MKPRRSTHRSMSRFLGRMLQGAKPAPFPGFVEPCRPTLRKVPPSGSDWLREVKHDGYRVQAQFNERPLVYTRKGNEWAARMPTIANALRSLPANNFIMDGELVAIDAKGRSAFYELPSELKARVKARLIYYAFDLLYLDGFDLRAAPLIARKGVLCELLKGTGLQLIRYCDHIEGDGPIVLEHARRLGLEGIVSKRASSPYRSGTTTAWIKTKCPGWEEANGDRFEQMRRL